jgi:hypothetical protein
LPPEMVHVSSKILTIRLLANTSPLFPHSCTTRSIHPTPTIGRNASRRHGAQATARSPKPNLTHACHSPPSLLKRHRAAKATEPQSPPTRCHVAGSDPPWLRAELHPPSPKTPPPQLEQYGAAGGPSVTAWQRRCVKMDQVSVPLVEYFKNLLYSKYSSRREIQGLCFSRQLRAIEILLNLF